MRSGHQQPPTVTSRGIAQVTVERAVIGGLRLHAVALPRARGGQPQADLDLQLRRTEDQIDLISTLWQTDNPLTYSLRFLSEPPAPSSAACPLTVALLVRAASAAGLEVALSDLSAVLASSQPDDEWRPLEQSVLEHLTAPFGWEDTHVRRVVRRSTPVHIGALRVRPSLDRRRQGDSNDPLRIVHPWSNRRSNLGKLLRLLVLQRNPVLVNVSLRPTELTGDETQLLIADIERCEAAQVDNHSTTTGEHHGAQAQALTQALLTGLVRLQDSPYLLQVTLAAPRRLSPTVVEALGAEVTAQPGEFDASLAGVYAGGYDVLAPADQASHQVAIRNLVQLDLEPWGGERVPAGRERLLDLMDAREAACAFRWPIGTPEGLPGLTVNQSRRRPQLVAEAAKKGAPGLVLGEAPSLAGLVPALWPEADRTTHAYVVGMTGTGKTTLLKQMILHDLQAGHGCMVIDPHGDLLDDLLALVPAEREADVVIIDPDDQSYPVGLNLLACQNDDERFFVAREMRAIMERLIQDQYGQRAADFAGPVFYQHLQMNMLLAMSRLDDPGTLLEFYQIYQSKSYWRRWLPPAWTDQLLTRWVDKTLPALDYTMRNSEGQSHGEYLSSKFIDFVFDPRLRLMFGQKRPRFDLAKAMDSSAIVLVRLAKGILSEANTRFLGMVLMAKLHAATMGRIRSANSARKPFYCYVDEFQNLATSSFTTLLSEARKFGVGLVLANQYARQLRDDSILTGLLGNVGTLIAFRLGSQDAESLEPEFEPEFDRVDLTHLNNYQACVRLVAHGERMPPFTLRTLRPVDDGDLSRAKRIRERSGKRWGTPRAVVEAEIADSLIDKGSPS